MINLLRRVFGGSPRPKAVNVAPSLALAAFGKHPGWDDHIPGVGLDTEGLADLKQSLYVSGIGGQIDSGAWEKLEPERRSPGFDHLILWQQADRFFLVELWSSTDRKGRSKYPMVLAVEAQGVSAQYLLEHVHPELRRLREICRSSTLAEQVVSACDSARNQLRGQLQLRHADELRATTPTEARQRFLAQPRLGPDRLGLLRLQHEVDTAHGLDTSAGRSTGTPRDWSGRHLRVPLTGDLPAGQIVLWSDFFQCALAPGIPLVLIHQGGTDWIDVLIGKPAREDFFCLQASPQTLPLATEIPYQVSGEVASRLDATIARFLSEREPGAVGTPALASLSPSAPPPLPPGTRSSRSGIGWMLALFALLGIVALGFFFWRGTGGQPQAGPGTTLVASSNTPSSVSPAPFLAQTNGTPSDAAAAVEPRPDEAEKAAQAEREARPAAEEKARAETAARRLTEEKVRADAEARRLAEEKAVTETRRLAAEQAAREQRYDAAMAAARAALVAREYSNVIKHASQAIQFKPDDAMAARFVADARQQLAELAALRQQEQQFETALTAVRAALAASRLTEATAKVDDALKLRPDDPAALKLKREIAQAADLEEARALLGRREFESALAVCARYPGVEEFDALARDIGVQKSPATSPPASEELAKLDAQFEKLQVMFGLLRPEAAQSPEARSTKRRPPPVSDLKRYLGEVDTLEAAYRAGGWLAANGREGRLGTLRKRIREYNDEPL